jgi:nicotinamidase/pyrazinamidase
MSGDCVEVNTAASADLLYWKAAAMSTTATPVEFAAGDALLLVDLQNDFCPGGSLGVVDGDQVIPVLNAWAAGAHAAHVPIFVTRDWHPPHTTHFHESGGRWPPHCVMQTHGSEFHPDVRLPADVRIVSKGMGETEDAYSAFQARDDTGALLEELLQREGTRRVYIGGLATDYCVRDSALDALAKGYRVTVILEGVRAVNLQPDDGARALKEMTDAGALTYGQ